MSFPEEKAAITAILSGIENPTVVELGSLNGEDMLWMAAACKGIPEIIMVEADPRNFALLPFIGWSTRIREAISDHDGTCSFWSSAASGGGFGSIYKPGEGLSVQLGDFTKIDAVPCRTFDSFCDWMSIKKIDLLCADIHGAEKDMIAHGQRALSRTRWLFIEAFKQPVYEGMATRDELLAMLPGWTLVQEFPWNLLLRNDNLQR